MPTKKQDKKELIAYFYNMIRRVSGYYREYHANNRERRVDYARNYYSSNRDLVIASQHKYRKNNPDKIASYNKKVNHELMDSKVINSLSRFINRNNITPELVELTKAKIRLQRKLKTLK